MGGESGGDIASKIAVETISGLLRQYISDDLSVINIRELLFDSILQADTAITNYIENHPDFDGMGTTILIGMVINDIVNIAWCGDSHCFLFNNGDIKSLTKDHSYVQELIDAKKISIEDSFTHPDNNLITRYIGGGDETCLPEFTTHKINDGDVMIFCSDGLSGYCRIDDIKVCISRNRNRQDLSQELSQLAYDNGSDDDTTIVTLIVKGPPYGHRSSFLGRLKQMIFPAT